jgi:hypothetical protein
VSIPFRPIPGIPPGPDGGNPLRPAIAQTLLAMWHKVVESPEMNFRKSSQRLAISALTAPAQALLDATAHLTDSAIVAARNSLIGVLQNLQDVRDEESSESLKRDQGIAAHPYPMQVPSQGSQSK